MSSLDSSNHVCHPRSSILIPFVNSLDEQGRKKHILPRIDQRQFHTATNPDLSSESLFIDPLPTMSSAYDLHGIDRTEEDSITPKPSPDPEPNHPLDPLITNRIISDTSDPTYSMPFDTTRETMRTKATFCTIMAGGTGY